MGSQCLMVGERQDVIAVAHVVRIDHIWIVWTFVDAFVHFGMGVQACPLPAYGGIKVRVGVVNPVTGERNRT